MKRTFTVILSLAACLSMSTSLLAVDPVKFEVFAAYAPNGRAPNTAPSWDDYVLNAIGALELGSPNVGDREVDPTAYETVSGTVSPLELRTRILSTSAMLRRSSSRACAVTR